MLPTYGPDLFSPAAIRDPHPHYAALRELGPVVWLRKQKVYALPRYAECKTVLLDHKTFISGAGVGPNPLVNRFGQGTTLYSDGTDHARRRAHVAHRLTPRALRAMTDTIDRRYAVSPPPSTHCATPDASCGTGPSWPAAWPRTSCGPRTKAGSHTPNAPI